MYKLMGFEAQAAASLSELLPYCSRLRKPLSLFSHGRIGDKMMEGHARTESHGCFQSNLMEIMVTIPPIKFKWPKLSRCEDFACQSGLSIHDSYRQNH
jgi:hypothetical protein